MKSNSRKRSKVAYKKSNMYVIIIAFLFICMCSVFFCFTFISKANTGRLYYKSIQIEKGDTIASIAASYNEHGFSNKDDFVYELNRLNRMSDDLIHEGAYLVIPYYL